jgi:RNase adaptor protein for sRNA GlmZ degradation
VKLFFLYGPPAVGKLTIAKILQQQTGYELLHNHLLQNPITEVFPFENPANHLLVREFRLRILEEAVKSDIDLIATFGIAGNDPFTHIADVIHTIETNNGEICLVHLSAEKEILLQRVEDPSRKEHGKNLSKEKLEEIMQQNPDMLDAYTKKEHMTIDTSKISPQEAAEKIRVYYKL